MVAFVDDHLPIVLDQRFHLALAGQGLHHGDVDLAGRPGLASANGAVHALCDAQKGLQALLPLLEWPSPLSRLSRVISARHVTNLSLMWQRRIVSCVKCRLSIGSLSSTV